MWGGWVINISPVDTPGLCDQPSRKTPDVKAQVRCSGCWHTLLYDSSRRAQREAGAQCLSDSALCIFLLWWFYSVSFCCNNGKHECNSFSDFCELFQWIIETEGHLGEAQRQRHRHTDTDTHIHTRYQYLEIQEIIIQVSSANGSRGFWSLIFWLYICLNKSPVLQDRLDLTTPEIQFCVQLEEWSRLISAGLHLRRCRWLRLLQQYATEHCNKGDSGFLECSAGREADSPSPLLDLALPTSPDSGHHSPSLVNIPPNTLRVPCFFSFKVHLINYNYYFVVRLYVFNLPY